MISIAAPPFDPADVIAATATAQARADLGVANAATAQARADLGVANAATAQAKADLAKITKSYVSGEQAIVTAGAINLSHGLAVVPALVQALLICKIAEQSFAVGDIVPINNCSNVGGATADKGHSIALTSSQLNIRQGSGFVVLNKNTGAGVQVLAANWNIIYKAWA